MQVKGIKNVTVKNRAETYHCHPELYFTPTSVEELKQIVAQARQQKHRIKVKGSGNSMSPLFLTSEYVIDMKYFNKVIEIDMEKEQVKVQGGALLQDLHVYLNKVGLDLSFIGAEPSLTAAGAINVATHTTGINSGTLSSYVVEVEIMTSDGQIVQCSRNKDEDMFRAVCCGLGAFGIIVTVTFQCETTFKVEKIQYGCDLDEILTNFDFYSKKSEHSKLLWFPHTNSAIVYHMNKTIEPVKQEFCKGRNFCWFRDVFVRHYLSQFIYLVGTLLPFLIPLMHWIIYQLFYTWGRYEIVQSKEVFPIHLSNRMHTTEWAVPIDKATSALNAVRTWFRRGPHYLHFPVEVSFIQKDDLFLSPASGVDVCYISITIYRPYNFYFPYEKAFADFAELMKKYSGRPQWGKEIFGVTSKDIQGLFPDWKKWNDIRQKLDPDEVFLNPFLEKLLTVSAR